MEFTLAPRLQHLAAQEVHRTFTGTNQCVDRADGVFECPRCLDRRDDGLYDWSAGRTEERSVPRDSMASLGTV